MLEPDLIPRALDPVHLHAEPRVVHHAHQVPSRQGRHAVLAVVPRAHADLGSAYDKNVYVFSDSRRSEKQAAGNELREFQNP